MAITFEIRYATNPDDFRSYDTCRIRKDFLIQDMMVEGNIKLVYSHYDRIIAGGAVPGKDRLKLEHIDPLKAGFFLERGGSWGSSMWVDRASLKWMVKHLN